MAVPGRAAEHRREDSASCAEVGLVGIVAGLEVVHDEGRIEDDLCAVLVVQSVAALAPHGDSADVLVMEALSDQACADDACVEVDLVVTDGSVGLLMDSAGVDCFAAEMVAQAQLGYQAPWLQTCASLVCRGVAYSKSSQNRRRPSCRHHVPLVMTRADLG